MKRLLFAVIAVLCLPVAGWAGIVHNHGTASSPEDSLCIIIRLLDTLGLPVQAQAGDSAFIRFYSPGGGGSVQARIALTVGATEQQILPTYGGVPAAYEYIYKVLISNFDGAGVNGTFIYT